MKPLHYDISAARSLGQRGLRAYYVGYQNSAAAAAAAAAAAPRFRDGGAAGHARRQDRRQLVRAFGVHALISPSTLKFVGLCGAAFGAGWAAPAVLASPVPGHFLALAWLGLHHLLAELGPPVCKRQPLGARQAACVTRRA